MPEDSFEVLGCAITIQTSSPEARARVMRIYGQFLAPSTPSATRFSVAEATAHAILTLEGEICNHIIECRSDLIGVHGAVLITPKGGLLLTGASGAGKSTLSLALTSLGWRLCTDDASFFDNGQLFPIPRCFHLDPQSCQLLAGIGLTRFADFDGTDILTPSDLFPGNPTSIPIRRIIYLKSEGAAELTPVSQAAMIALLCSESGRGHRAWEDALPELVQLVSSADSWIMTRQELSGMVADIAAHV